MEWGHCVARRFSQDQPGALQAPRGVLSPGRSAHPQPEHGHQPGQVQAGVTSSTSTTPELRRRRIKSHACHACPQALRRHKFTC